MTTPTFNTTGTFTLTSPFETASDSTVYTCEAIQSFDALTKAGIDVYTTYYQANGLSETTYKTDVQNDESIVTLIPTDSSLDTLYVPTSYIDEVPDTTTVAYSRVFLTFDLSLLPDDVDFTATIEHLQEVLEFNIGNDIDYQISRVSVTDVIDEETSASMETARQALIDLQDTPSQQLATANALIETKDAYIANLEELITTLQS